MEVTTLGIPKVVIHQSHLDWTLTCLFLYFVDTDENSS